MTNLDKAHRIVSGYNYYVVAYVKKVQGFPMNTTQVTGYYYSDFTELYNIMQAPEGSTKLRDLDYFEIVYWPDNYTGQRRNVALDKRHLETMVKWESQEYAMGYMATAAPRGTDWL